MLKGCAEHAEHMQSVQSIVDQLTFPAARTEEFLVLLIFCLEKNSFMKQTIIQNKTIVINSG